MPNQEERKEFINVWKCNPFIFLSSLVIKKFQIRHFVSIKYSALKIMDAQKVVIPIGKKGIQQKPE